MSLRHGAYAAMLLFVLAGCLPLHRVYGLSVLRQPRRLALAVLPVAVVFAAWDVAATAAGHWHFDPSQTLAVRVAGLPLEEYAFFVVIPLAGILTYEAVGLAAVVGVAVAVGVDLVVLRTRLLATSRWWLAYAIVLFFQLLTNGWLTGRGIVRYASDAIIGSSRITFLGDGRVVWAPVEDLLFGFALVLLTCAAWVWVGARPHQPSRR